MFESKKENSKSNVFVKAAAFLLCLAALIINAAVLTGCGGSATSVKADSYGVNATSLSTEGIEPTDTMIVCAVVKGQAFRLPDGALAQAKSGVEGERYVGLVMADGTSSVSGMRYETTKKTESSIAKEIRANTQDYLDYACSLRASAPGVHLLESMNAAANELHAKGNGSMTICVISSGITDGAAATTPDLLGADSAYIVSQLAANGSIADYHGITVRFYGIGQSTGDQVIPDSTALSLKDLWARVVEAGGGQAVFCTDVLTPLGCDDALPSVTHFDYPADSLVIPKLAPSQTMDLVLGEDVLRFQGDLAEFADAAQADSTLREYARAISERGYKVSIAGYTADSPARSADFLQKLSEDRAQAVAQGLVERGVSSSAITSVEGFGPSGSTSMTSGSFNEDQARLDRRVVLTVYAAV